MYLCRAIISKSKTHLNEYSRIVWVTLGYGLGTRSDQQQQRISLPQMHRPVNNCAYLVSLCACLLLWDSCASGTNPPVHICRGHSSSAQWTSLKKLILKLLSGKSLILKESTVPCAVRGILDSWGVSIPACSLRWVLTQVTRSRTSVMVLLRWTNWAAGVLCLHQNPSFCEIEGGFLVMKKGLSQMGYFFMSETLPKRTKPHHKPMLKIAFFIGLT